MPRKKIRTTTEVLREEEVTNPTSRLVRDFIETGVYPDELRDLQFKIDVQKYNREGKPVRIVNAVYDNLEELPDRLGSRFGAGRFRLFVSVLDDQGKKTAFVRIEDFELETATDPADQQVDDDPADAVAQARTTALDLQMLKMQQDHATLMKMMEQNTQIVIAALSQKQSGGSGSLSTVLQAVKVGRDLASGADVTDGDADLSGDTGQNAMALLNSPIVATLANAIVQGILKQGATPTAAPLGNRDNGQPPPPPMP